MAVDSLEVFTWRSIGPPRGGRVSAVAGDPSDRSVFYFGACGGGVWKTDDGGTYWRNVSDGFLRTAAVGALAVSRSDPNVVYAGMGESCVRNNVAHGDGVYRSSDAGRTWLHRGLEATRHISRVRVHPADPDLVYVAALGDIFGPNPERGIYRSRDGGDTWDHVLYKSQKAGAADLAMDATNPRILYATIWQAQRTPWAMLSGGPDSSLYRSSDGGETWENISTRPGFPAALKGRMGVAASPARAGRVWALVEAADGDGGLYRSEDAGDSWERISEDKAILGRPWYYSHLVADPNDADTIYSLNFQFWKSSDGGRTFHQVTTPHGDNHDLWIDPNDSRRMIEGNDGGACVSYNGGESFSTLYNQPTGQFYHVTTDDQFPYRVYGTQQDNSAISVPSRSRRGAIVWTDCYPVGFSESGHIAVDPKAPNVIYSGAVGSAPGGGGPLLRYDHATGQTQIITVWPEYSFGEDPKDWKHRFQWTYPILFSPHDPNTLYVTGERVFRSRDKGSSWEAISPDLTRADPEKMVASGGPITKDTSGAEVYCTIFSFSESPLSRGTLWVGTDDGLVHVSRNGGKTWKDVTPSKLPDWALVTAVEPSPHSPGTAYACATRYRLQDRTPYLFKTSDFGTTWKLITKGIPDGDFTRVIRADPVRPGLLYAGTEHGIYVSLDDGGSWQRLASNLPTSPVYDLCIKGSDLVAATNGRGFYILDDVTPLREMSAGRRRGLARLFTPPPAYRYPTLPGTRASAPGKNYMLGSAFIVKTLPDGEKQHLFLDAGNNPRDGITVWYELREDVEDLELTFLDPKGKEIASFTPDLAAPPEDEEEEEPEPLTASAPEGEEGEGQAIAEESAAEPEPPARPDKRKKKWWESLPHRAGIHRFTWDLRGPGVLPVPDEKRERRAATGWLVAPGSYTVRLRARKETHESSFDVLKDPRIPATLRDLNAQYAFLTQVRDAHSAVNEAIGRLRRIKKQVDPWIDRAGAGQTIGAAASEVSKSLAAIEKRLTQPKITHDTDRLKLPVGLDGKLAAIPEVVASADTAPTRQSREVFEKISGRVDATLADFDRVVATEVGALNTLIAEAQIPVIDTTP